jgi:NADH-quinone oxidoreductase subunit L
VLVIGATTAFFMGLIGIVQNDIKRVVAYSTLSQLGYMTVALGVSAYSAGLFHLMTHAFFKALLFLAAGSVIIAMHHEQDMRNMGGLRKYMPITYWTSLVGTLALIGFPGFSGFFSKDAIIEAVHARRFRGRRAYWAVLLGVFVTALYSFRMYFLVFHGKERYTIVPSVVIGYLTIGPVLFGDWLRRDASRPAGQRHVVGEMGSSTARFALACCTAADPPFWLAMAGFVLAWFVYMKNPAMPGGCRTGSAWASRCCTGTSTYVRRALPEKLFPAGSRASARSSGCVKVTRA